MPVYRMTIKGRRKPILTKAESAAKARDSLVECELVNAEEMVDALTGGEKLWAPGDDLPEDEPEPAPKLEKDNAKPCAPGPANKQPEP